MYVRNYGVPPRSVRKDDEAPVLGVAPTQLPENAAPQTLPSEENLTETESVGKPAATENTEATEEPSTAPLFGENGLPRQPLRRRKRPSKSDKYGKSPKNGELPSQNGDANSEPLSPIECPCVSTSTTEAYCEEEQSGKKNREERIPVQDPLPCRKEPQRTLGCF